MFPEVNKKLLAVCLAIASIISGGLWLAGVFPLWGALVAVPVLTFVALVVLVAVGVLGWLDEGAN